MPTKDEKDNLLLLLKKYSKGTASAQECFFIEEYFRYFDSMDGDFESFTLIEKEEIRAGLLDKINKRIGELESDKVIPIYTQVLRIASVAAILLIVAGAGFLLFKKNLNEKLATSKVQFPHYKNDVIPGHNGAILTLSNGQKIILDTLGNGELLKDANISVIKKDGEIIYQGKPSEMVYNTVSTDKARQWQIVLPDGSKVWLNASSSIRFPLAFINNERVVEISGEAYLEVIHNSKKPFKVKLPDGSMVEDIGTSFNIHAYKDEANSKTTLIEGLVSISQNGTNKILKPGQQAQIYKSFNNNNNNTISIINNVDLEETLAWKNGYFKFNGSSIEEVMKQVERWYNVEVIYKDKISDDFVAKIKRDVPVSEILELLEGTGLVHFEINGNKITVKK